MIAAVRLTMAFVLLTVPDAAFAHSVFGTTGFSGGLLHPLIVPAHVMTVGALALLIGQQRWGCSVPIVYVGALGVGLAAIALAYVPVLAEQALLALAAMAGLLVALARPLHVTIGSLLAAAAGLALALDSPPEAISLVAANLALIGTALSATLFLLALAWLASRLRHDWQRIGARIVGSWIAASALLVLALRLAK